MMMIVRRITLSILLGGCGPNSVQTPPADGGLDGDADVLEDAPADVDGGDAEVAPGTWQSVGPFVGGVYTVEVDPFDADTLYLGATGWMWRSTDHGENWEIKPWPVVQDGRDHLPDAWSLAPSPAQEGLIYAGTMFEDVYVSEEHGENWSYCCEGGNCGLPLGLGQFARVLAHPTDPGTVYVGVFWGCYPARFLVPGAPDCVGDGGVYKSVDFCSTFTQVNGAGDSALDNTRVDAFAIDPVDPDVLYVGTLDGIYRSADGGESWSLDYDLAASGPLLFWSMDVASDHTVYAAVVAADPLDSRWVLKRNAAGVWSDANVDNGLPAAPIDDPFLDMAARAWSVDASSSPPGTVYVATHDFGAFVSHDSGDSFTPVEVENLEDSPDKRLYCAKASPSDPDRVYLCPVSDALLQKGGAQDAWRRTWWRSYPSAFAFSAASPASVFASLMGGGTAYSSDEGRTWHHAVNSIAQADSFGIQVHPTDADILYVGMPLTAEKVVRSDDGGETWTNVSGSSEDPDQKLPQQAWTNGVMGLVLDPDDPDTLYVALMDTGVYRSEDAGTTWIGLPEGLAVPAVSSLAASPGTADVIYAGSFTWSGMTLVAQVYRRGAASPTWEPLGTTFSDCNAVAQCSVRMIAATADTVYAATKDQGLYVLPNGELDWHRIGSSSGLTSDYLTSVAVHPDRPEWVAVGAMQDPSAQVGGVFLSTDGGNTFAPLVSGLDDLRIFTLAFVPDTRYLLAGTYGSGVFRVELTP